MLSELDDLSHSDYVFRQTYIHVKKEKVLTQEIIRFLGKASSVKPFYGEHFAQHTSAQWGTKRSPEKHTNKRVF